MNPATSYLGNMLLEEITPVVMVLRTPLVEESCRKNGFNLVQMLHPFSLFNNIDVPVRTASDQPYRLHKFKLRLHYASDIRQPNVEVAEGRLKRVVSEASENDVTDLHSDPPQLENLVSAARSDSTPSWFQIFNKELIHTSSFSEHEVFDHPVACLVVVSSKDEQPINKFVDLFNTSQLPSLFNDGAMDPKILKHYLLIHDNQDGTSEKATNILTEMRGTFGSNDCGMLCINSAQDGLGDLQDNLWMPFKFEAPLGKDLGCFLNNDDITEIKDLMQDLSSKHIIPHMEQKIRSLNQQVSATRKGFRNQIKNLWWRKGKEDTPDAPNSTMYTFSSIESQIRVLGDYAFMLRDYELALSNYRLLSTDYKLDKAWKRYAGVQEMMALTYFLLDQSRKDAEYCMENAFTTYLKLGSSGQRNATRCGLWWTEMLKTRNQYKEAADVYFRISNEEPSLHAAVMLEQASYCYFLSDPPMLRKYGFHLVLAGSRYYISDQRKHAIRAYRSALSVYKGNSWKHISDHVHFHIGKWYAFLEIFDIAIKHMLEVLACGHQSVVTQELFLRDFLLVVQKLGKTFEVFKLPLPVINVPSLKVIFEDHRTSASSAAINVRESLWQTLEEDLVPSIPTMRTNWLESQPKLSKRYKDSNICIAGEAIKVDIQFRNPLKISLLVSGVSLICQLSEKAEAMKSQIVDQNVNDLADQVSGIELQSDLDFNKLKHSWELNADSSLLVMSETDFSLRGSETTTVQLMVTPKVEGILNIIGVRWKLSESVVGYHSFDSNLLKKKNVKRRRRVKQSPSSNLKFTVIKNLPKLEGCIHHLPNTAYTGELRRLLLELRNPSEFSVKNLKMKINYPRFLIPGSLDDIKGDFPACLEKQENHEHSIMQANAVQGSNGLLFSFPEDVVILGDTTFSWPLWLRAGIPGCISLYISIYYEMQTASSDMRYRTLRMYYNLEVSPSLDISFRISPCPSRLQEFLVRMDILNRTSSQSFQLHQLSSVGSQWEISSLPPDGTVCPSSLLIAGQALSCFFKIKSCSKATSEGTSFSFCTLLGSDERLDSQGSNKVMFDTSRTPLANFHDNERRHQEKSVEGNSSTIDFVLISQPQENISSPLDLTRLFSHHACHCSVTSTSPVWWIMKGPRVVRHDFCTSFCEIRLSMTIHNSSSFVAAVHIDTFDPQSTTGRLSDAAAAPQSPSASVNQEGWHDVSLVTDIKVTTDIFTPKSAKLPSPDSITPFIWSASSSTRVEIEPMSSTEVPLQICLFAPGTYNLSNYKLHWSLELSPENEKLVGDAVKQTSRTSSGHPYYLTVLQS